MKAFLLLLALVAWVIWSTLRHVAGRWSEKKLREMRSAFDFVHEHGMSCVAQVDRGVGATVEYRGADLWLKVHCDRGDYCWEFGLAFRPEFHFSPADLCATAAQAAQFHQRSVRVLGEITRQDFPYFVAAIQSEKASELVRRRRARAARGTEPTA